MCTGASAIFLLLTLVTLVSSKTLDLVGPVALLFALTSSDALQFTLAGTLPLPVVAILALPGLHHHLLR